MIATRRRAATLPAEGIFVAASLSQYGGAALAVLLFEAVPAAGVAWLRVASSALVLAVWRRPWRAGFALPRPGLAVAFGATVALMNLSFYLSIDRLPLGTAVAVEFIGPVAVAAFGSRTRRDLAALLVAGAGVVLLVDVHLSGSPAGVALALAAAALWAAYIVIGHAVARIGEGVDALAVGMAAGAVLIAPLSAPAAGAAFGRPALLLACVAVGLLSSVVPYALDQVALRRLARARFALLLALLPATAVAMGALVLGQLPGAAELAGIGLVVLAVALRPRGDEHDRDASDTPPT